MTEEVKQGVKVDEPVKQDVKVESIPYERFKQVNDELKTLREEREKRAEADRKAEETRLAEEGRYKELLAKKDEELETVKPFKEKWETYQQTRREALIEKIPEEKRKFADAMDLLTLEDFVNEYTPQPSPTVSKDRPGSRSVYKDMRELSEDYVAGKISKENDLEQKRAIAR